MYVEGVDFVNDYSDTPLMPYFGVTIGFNGFPNGINHLEGVPGSIADGLDFNYLFGAYPDYMVDEISLEGADAVLVSPDNNNRVTSYATRESRTIASSIVIGGIYDSDEHTKAELMNRYIQFLLPTTSNDENSQPVATAELHSAYPNPFNPTTTISFSLKEKQQFSLDIYDIKGRHVTTLAEGLGDKGLNSVIWKGIDSNGKSVNSGVYFCRLKTTDSSLTTKLTLLK